jgi:hypothetical protein
MTGEEAWGAAEAAPELDHRPPVPWEDPELSGLAGFFRTLRDLLLRPGEFFAALGREGWSEPLAFALIVGTGGFLVALFWHLLVLAPAGSEMGDAARSPALGLEPGVLLAVMAGSPVLVLVNLGVGSLCWWGSVALVGAGREFTSAWRIFCYAQGGMALALIPFFGLLAAGIWILVLMYHGAKGLYGLSSWASQGALVIFLTLQAALGMILLAGLLAALACLGFLFLLG